MKGKAKMDPRLRGDDESRKAGVILESDFRAQKKAASKPGFSAAASYIRVG